MAQYGCEVAPHGPQQDMFAIDTIAGSVHDRTDDPREFTGGDGERGLGGKAEPGPDGGTVYQRIGF